MPQAHRHPCRRGVIVCLLVLAASVGGLRAAEAPRLGNPRIYPTSGDTTTAFTFMISYYGSTTPAECSICLDSGVFAMKYAGAGAQGSTTYTYQTKLAAGTHRYRFRFRVGTQVLLMPGPTEDKWYTTPAVAQARTCTVSGLIKANGAALTRATVKLAKAGATAVTVSTNSTGRFTAAGLASGTWTVTPTKTGYTMTPTSKRVTVPPDTSTCDFTANRSS